MDAAGLATVALALLAVSSCWTTTAMALSGTTKAVTYRGYRLAVPAAWPVFDLSSRPRVCVEFDRHAVYLGRPSSAQDCPAHAVGRTEAILVQPLGARAARAAQTTELPAGQSSARVVNARTGVVVTATWGSDRSVIERALGRSALPPARAPAARAAPGQAAGRRAIRSQSSKVFTGLGFDACSAPSESRMSAWGSSPYGAIGIYIGGANMACAQPNLSARWINDQSAAGWRMIPTYVGLQAPSNDCGCAGIDRRHAAAEGAAAAKDAVTQAAAVGLGPANPIYFDMEGYRRTGPNTSAVLAFLSAWTSQLHAQGYLAGVYSGANSGIRDLADARGSGIDEPDDIWMADWNGEQSTASPYVPGGDWSNHARLHQFEGGHDETHGGARMNVDSNYLDGATAASASASPPPPIPDGTYVQVPGSSDIYEIVGGAPLFVSPQYSGTFTPQPLTSISQQEFDQLSPVPADGSLVRDSNGVAYRVAGGSPMFVSALAAVGAQPVTIDAWDVANLDNPVAHLSSVPANGTFLTTTAGAVYRVAGGAALAISSWSPFGGVNPAVTVDQSDVTGSSNPGAHLSAVPRNGTAVEGLPSRTYWVFVAGQRKLTSPSLAAVQVADSGLSVFPAIPCVVPHLRGLSLFGARRALQSADCRVGRVRVRRASSARSRRVVRQTARPLTRHAGAYRVGITLA